MSSNCYIILISNNWNYIFSPFEVDSCLVSSVVVLNDCNRHPDGMHWCRAWNWYFSRIALPPRMYFVGAK
jgi:hypothetical protein